MSLLSELELLAFRVLIGWPKEAKKVCVLEQSTSPSNLNGASHGETRIIRLIHSDKIYVPMAIESYRFWRGLEHEVGSKLYENHGLLWLGDEQGSKERAEILRKHNASHELLNSKEINNRYKHLNYDSKWFAVLDHTGGTIYARKSMEALKKANEKMGVDFYYGHKMTKWESNGSSVTVNTPNHSFRGKNLVLAVGGWIEKLATGLKVRVQPVAVPVYFWDIEKEASGLYDIEKRSPNLIISDVWKNEEVFMIPNGDFEGKVKFGVHKGENFEIDTVRPTNLIATNREISRQHIKEHVKYLDSRKPSIETGCLYADTEDKSFLIDKHPKYKNVILATGFSGTGFKFGPSIGELVSDLVDNKLPKYDISGFSVQREIDLLKSKL